MVGLGSGEQSAQESQGVGGLLRSPEDSRTLAGEPPGDARVAPPVTNAAAKTATDHDDNVISKRGGHLGRDGPRLRTELRARELPAILDHHGDPRAICKVHAEVEEMALQCLLVRAPPLEENLVLQFRNLGSHREDERQVHLEMAFDLHDLFTLPPSAVTSSCLNDEVPGKMAVGLQRDGPGGGRCVR